MTFQELALRGAYVIDIDPHVDERGFFARVFAEEEFEARGLAVRFPHCNLSRNSRRGTLRGMHYAAEPVAEAKLIRCVAGAIYDVIVDLREDEATFGQWVAVELTAHNARALYVPPRFAHGFLTLSDATDVFYQMSDVFRPDSARGFRWNDATFGIEWPETPTVISARDAGYADFAASRHDLGSSLSGV